MKIFKGDFTSRMLIGLISIAMLWTIPLAGAQSSGTGGVIDSGTTIYVRTVQEIDTSDSDGHVFPGVVDKDVLGSRGRVVIPQGSDVELVVRRVSDKEL